MKKEKKCAKVLYSDIFFVSIFNQNTLCTTNIVTTFLSKFIPIFLFIGKTKFHTDIEIDKIIHFIGFLKDHHDRIFRWCNHYHYHKLKFFSHVKSGKRGHENNILI